MSATLASESGSGGSPVRPGLEGHPARGVRVMTKRREEGRKEGREEMVNTRVERVQKHRSAQPRDAARRARGFNTRALTATGLR